MPNPNQRNIPVDKAEGAELERRKQLYEREAGETGDWGKALGILTLGGLAALGIYALVKATRPTSTTWQVICPNERCKAKFPVAIAGSPARLGQVVCPHCETEMVVDFGHAREKRFREADGHSALVPGAIIHMTCRHCGREMNLTITGGGKGVATTLKCPFCGRQADYGIGEAR